MSDTVASAIELYVQQKKALGRVFTSEERELRRFERFLLERDIDRIEQITADVADEYVGTFSKRTTAKSFNNVRGHTARFFDWLVRFELLLESPLRLKSRVENDKRRPFIFSSVQIGRLLDFAGALPDFQRFTLRGPTYQACFAVMFGLGLRAGEVSRLLWEHFDERRRLLVVVESKFDKSRLVPFGPRLGTLLDDYRDRRIHREGAISPSQPLFSVDGVRPIHVNKFNKVLQHLLPCLELEVPAGVAPPVAHHLRHSFAVARLLRWYRQGVDPSERLLQLSTFMGHANPAATAHHLTITSDILEEAARRFERRCSPSMQMEQV